MNLKMCIFESRIFLTASVFLLFLNINIKYRVFVLVKPKWCVRRNLVADFALAFVSVDFSPNLIFLLIVKKNL